MIRKTNRRLTPRYGFSLIEVLLAIGILGGTILCLLGVFSPTLFKAREIERIQDAGDIEGKVNGFIQSCSFNDIFMYVKDGQCFYFYKDTDGIQRVTKVIREIEGHSITKVTLNALECEDIRTCEAKNYPRSYLTIDVGIQCLKDKGEPKGMKTVTSSFITIKNR